MIIITNFVLTRLSTQPAIELKTTRIFLIQISLSKWETRIFIIFRWSSTFGFFVKKRRHPQFFYLRLLTLLTIPQLLIFFLIIQADYFGSSRSWAEYINCGQALFWWSRIFAIISTFIIDFPLIFAVIQYTQFYMDFHMEPRGFLHVNFSYCSSCILE